MKKEKNISTSNLELDHFEEDKAVLLTMDNVEIVLPKHFIPEEVSVGDTVAMTVTTDEAQTKAKEQKARDLLNEILNIG